MSAAAFRPSDRVKLQTLTTRAERLRSTHSTSSEGATGHGGSLPRLLYLGFAFPPGLAALHPDINPAGHALETQLVSELRRFFDVRSAGVLPFEAPTALKSDGEGVAGLRQLSSGVDHDVVLVEKPPELTYRIRALKCLKSKYLAWRAASWAPDAILVYNLSPIYNQFLLWLRGQPECPKLVLLLLDSPNLGRQISWFKRLRHRFKPMTTPDEEMLEVFDACVGLSRDIEKHFAPRHTPFLWMPGGCSPQRVCAEINGFGAPGEQKRFGYFGALGPYAGVQPMVETFLGTDLAAALEICGYGKGAADLKQRADQDQRLRFHGLLSPAECLKFGRACDLLINPRPATHGNENNFASKLFDYALTGRAILTSRLSGVEEVLGPEALYFDPHDFENNLRASLRHAVAMPRSELFRRGADIQQRVLTDFTWEKQGARLAGFLESICALAPARAELPAALAA